MFAAEGAVCADSIATCARVRTCGVMLIMNSACSRRAVRHFCARAWLVGWVGRAGGLLVVLTGLGTLGTGGDKLVVRVILWFISVWGRSTSAIVCTLGTCCPLVLCVGVAVCSNHSGCAFMCACVVLTMHWSSSVSGEVLSLIVMCGWL